MNLCLRCTHKIGLKPRYVNLLKTIKWCDHCKTKRDSFDIMMVVDQLLVVEGDK